MSRFSGWIPKIRTARPGSAFGFRAAGFFGLFQVIALIAIDSIARLFGLFRDLAGLGRLFGVLVVFARRFPVSFTLIPVRQDEYPRDVEMNFGFIPETSRGVHGSTFLQGDIVVFLPGVFEMLVRK